ncbi:MAG: hypothetical protein ACTSYD_10290 [Candidatus Heimdallarchaeaceae archaeon]
MQKKSIAIIMLVLMSFFSSGNNYFLGVYSSSSYVIMFDESHGQYFNSSIMTRAIKAIYNLTNDVPDISIKVLINKDSQFNSTNLQGVDLLIITNPGINSEFTSEEINAILDYVELGGSLFLLANPLTKNESITGHANIINDILSARNNKLTTARIRPGLNISHSTVIVDDFNHVYDNDSYVHYTEINFNHTIFQQDYEIQNMTLYSTSIELGGENEQYAVGRTSVTAYSVNEQYEIFRDPVNHFLTWLLAKMVGKSRFVISGSTIMFSDLIIANNKTWINEAQNLELWKNIILWLLKITPHEQQIIFPVWSFEYFTAIVVIMSIAIFGTSLLLYKLYEKRKTKVSVK